MEDNETIHVTLQPGWPIVVKQDLIFSELSDAEFRVVCAYLARDEENQTEFEKLISQYNPDGVASVIRWVRKIGLTRNG
jgi:hypothetical protein